MGGRVHTEHTEKVHPSRNALRASSDHGEKGRGNLEAFGRQSPPIASNAEGEGARKFIRAAPLVGGEVAESEVGGEALYGLAVGFGVGIDEIVERGACVIGREYEVAAVGEADAM